MKQVAIVGTQGVPASYGGFETLVENIIGDNCPPDIQYTVFCSSKDIPNGKKRYKGCRLKYIPLHAKVSLTIFGRCVKSYKAMIRSSYWVHPGVVAFPYFGYYVGHG